VGGSRPATSRGNSAGAGSRVGGAPRGGGSGPRGGSGDAGRRFGTVDDIRSRTSPPPIIKL